MNTGIVKLLTLTTLQSIHGFNYFASQNEQRSTVKKTACLSTCI